MCFKRRFSYWFNTSLWFLLLVLAEYQLNILLSRLLLFISLYAPHLSFALVAMLLDFVFLFSKQERIYTDNWVDKAKDTHKTNDVRFLKIFIGNESRAMMRNDGDSSECRIEQIKTFRAMIAYVRSIESERIYSAETDRSNS